MTPQSRSQNARRTSGHARCPSGELLFTESDIKWLSSLVNQEQRITQSRFDAARLQGSRKAIALGRQLERLYSLSYQLSQPLERRARAVARALKAEEAATAAAREEEIARLTSSQSPKGDGIPTPLQSGVSLNRTAMSGRSRFRGLIHCKLGFTLLRFSGFRLAQ